MDLVMLPRILKMTNRSFFFVKEYLDSSTKESNVLASSRVGCRTSFSARWKKVYVLTHLSPTFPSPSTYSIFKRMDNSKPFRWMLAFICHKELKARK